MGLYVAQVDVTTFSDETSWFLLLVQCGIHQELVFENEACPLCSLNH